MEDNKSWNFLECLIGYFVAIFIASWLAEKYFYAFSNIKILFLDGKILKALLLAAVTYGVYYGCAAMVMDLGGDDGKGVIAIILIFSLYGVYQDIKEVAGNKEGLEFVGTTVLYLLYTIEDTLRIVATLHAVNDSR